MKGLRNQVLVLLCMLCFALVTDVQAQPKHKGHRGKNPERALMKSFYKPEMVLKHASDIRLGDKEQKQIMNWSKNMEKEFVDLKWDLKEEMGKMKALVEAEKADESKIMAQMDKVNALEMKMKKQRLAVLIKVKNLLDSDQRAQLDNIKKEHQEKRKQKKMQRGARQ